jgi:hypothetical protein
MIAVMAAEHVPDAERPAGPPPARGWWVQCLRCGRDRLVTAEAIRAGAWLRCPHGEPAAGTRGDGAERIGHDGTPQG